MKVYRVYVNDKELDKFLVTEKDLADINIKNIIPNVNTYTHYKGEYGDDYYNINNREITVYFKCIGKAIVD
jgi:hypothetical protein